jgi:hypothetical protein
MKRALLLMLWIVLSCSKAMPTANSAYKNAPEKNSATNEREDMVLYVEPPPNLNSLPALEALIERDLSQLGLPSMWDSYATRPADELKYVPPVANTAPQPKSPANDFDKQPASTKGDNTAGLAKGEKQDTCQKTCALIDNICDASERICQITEKLPNDPDAPKRCERAKNACTRAKQQGAQCPC